MRILVKIANSTPDTFTLSVYELYMYPARHTYIVMAYIVVALCKLYRVPGAASLCICGLCSYCRPCTKLDPAQHTYKVMIYTVMAL